MCLRARVSACVLVCVECVLCGVSVGGEMPACSIQQNSHTYMHVLSVLSPFLPIPAPIGSSLPLQMPTATWGTL